jgi:poly-gamma-glutamate synthesis protein (capsule biosynthesis protein)
VKLALAGDTMLGRGVAERLLAAPGDSLFAQAVVEAAHEADLFVLNLECCISDRGEPWPDPRKSFFFRAPPAAAGVLAELGVSCVTLANNHALDFGRDALLDTIGHLAGAGIGCVGAGATSEAARAPVVLEGPRGCRLAIVGFADYPAEYAAGPALPGIAHATLSNDLDGWVSDAVHVDADAVVVTPHWGPNMVAEPLRSIRAAASVLLRAGATLVAGHSAHVFHGVEGRVLYDLGDFVDDYVVDPLLRNDLGLLWLVTLDECGPRELEVVPLRLEYARTRLATGMDAAWIGRRFRSACGELGADVEEREDGRLAVVFA